MTEERTLTSRSTYYKLISIVLFLFLSNLYIQVKIIDEKKKLIFERLLINGVSKWSYYLETLFELIIINIVFILIINDGMIFYYHFIVATIQMFIYSLALQYLNLDKNTYIMYYIVICILLSIIYIIPGIGISYASPVEVIGKVFM